MRLRIALGAAGVLLGLFGVFRLLTQVPLFDVLVLVGWLVGAVVVHDAILSPLVLAVGSLVTGLVPRRAAGYVQGALVAGGLISVIAVPMIYRQGSQPPQKAILEQNFGGNLALLLALVLAGTLLLYVLRVVLEARAAKRRPPEDHTASTS